MDYTKLSDQKLLKILMCNPPDVPHYQKAQGALQMRNQRKESGVQVWLLIFAGAALVVELLRLFLAH